VGNVRPEGLNFIVANWTEPGSGVTPLFDLGELLLEPLLIFSVLRRSPRSGFVRRRASVQYRIRKQCPCRLGCADTIAPARDLMVAVTQPLGPSMIDLQNCRAHSTTDGLRPRISGHIKVSRLTDGTLIHTGQRVNPLSYCAFIASFQAELRVTLATKLAGYVRTLKWAESNYRGYSWVWRTSRGLGLEKPLQCCRIGEKEWSLGLGVATTKETEERRGLMERPN